MNFFKKILSPQNNYFIKSVVTSLSAHDSHKDFVRKSISILLMQVFSIILFFVINILLARYLGVKGYGFYTFLLAWVSVLSVIATAGWDGLLVREITKYQSGKKWGLLKGLLGRSNRVVLISSFTLLTLVLAGSYFLPFFHEVHLPKEVLAISLLLLPFLAFANLRQAALRGLNKVVTGQIPEKIIFPFCLLFLIVIIWYQSKYQFSVFSVLVLNLIAIVISFSVGSLQLWYHTKKLNGLDPPQYEQKLWLKSALFFLLLSGMGMLDSQIDIVMLGSIKSTAEVGIYNAAKKISLIISFILYAVNIVLSPLFSRLYYEKDFKLLQNVFTFSARITSVIALSLFILIFIFGNDVLVLFGKEFIAGKTTLLILSAGQLFNIFAGSVGILLVMTGYERETVICLGIGVGVNIVMNILLTPKWGIEGTAIATTAGITVWNILTIYFVYKRLKIYPTVLGAIKQL